MKDEVRKLLDRLQSPDPVGCVSAAEELRRIGDRSAPVILALLKGATHREDETLKRIYGVMRDLGVPISGVVPSLTTMLRDPDAAVRASAARELGVRGFDARPAISELAALLWDRDLDARESAMDAIRLLAPPFQAIGILNPLRDHPDEQTRSSIQRILQGIAGDEERQRALVETLNHGDAKDRVSAARDLQHLGPAAEPAIPALLAALRDEDHEVRWGAFWALYGLSPDGRRIIPAFAELIGDPDAGIRKDAAGFLAEGILCREAGMEAPPVEACLVTLAVEALVQALRDSEDVVRMAAARALGDLRVHARGFVSALAALRGDPNEGVRATVNSAIDRITGA